MKMKAFTVVMASALTIGMLSGCGSETSSGEGGTVSTAGSNAGEINNTGSEAINTGNSSASNNNNKNSEPKSDSEIEAMTAAEYVQYVRHSSHAGCTVDSLVEYPEEYVVFIEKVKRELEDGPAITTERPLFYWDLSENDQTLTLDKSMPINYVCTLMKLAAEQQGYTEIDFDTISAIDFEVWFYDKFIHDPFYNLGEQEIEWGGRHALTSNMVNGLIRLHLVEDPSELEEQELEELEEQEIEEQNGALVSWMNQYWTPEMYPNTIVTFDLNKNYLFDERDHKLVERTETE